MQSVSSPIIGPIVSIGDLVADLVVAIPTLPAEAGRHQIAEEIRLEPGGGANFLIGDGSVHFVGEFIDYKLYNELGTREGGEPVSLPE